MLAEVDDGGRGYVGIALSSADLGMHTTVMQCQVQMRHRAHAASDELARRTSLPYAHSEPSVPQLCHGGPEVSSADPPALKRLGTSVRW